MFGFGKKKQDWTVEGQLDALADVGIRLLPGRSIEELFISCAREEYESDPFRQLLFVMGNEVEEEPWDRLFSHDIWHFDTECIEDHGAYVAILRRLMLLAGEDLPIKDLRDFVDIDEGVAWLEFSLDGKVLRFEPVVDSDWVDPNLFGWIQSIVEERSARGRFTYCDTHGQDCLIGYATPDQLKRIRKVTAQDFVWLQ